MMTFRIDEAHDGRVLREFLRRDNGFSSALLKHLKFMPGGITVNGESVTVRRVLRAGDTVCLLTDDRPDDVSPYITPASLALPVVYEDDWLTVVNKPPLMPAHPSFGHRDDTVANALAYRYGQKPYVFRPVNRLDRDTSGLMLTANSQLAAVRLQRQMMAGGIRKVYLALLDGTPEEPCGIRRGYIRRKDGSIMEREETFSPTDGKRAVTAYRTLWTQNGYSVVAASPLTGRTHQLRVHFAGMNCPIVGDDLYGHPSPLLSRQALHAALLAHCHPDSGAPMLHRAALPEDVVRAMEALFGENAPAVLERCGAVCFDDLPAAEEDVYGDEREDG